MNIQWRQTMKPSFGTYVELPLPWPGNYHNSGVKFLHTPQPGKGMLDIRYEFSGEGAAGTNTTLLSLKGITDTGHEGDVNGITVRLDHKNGAKLGRGFNITDSVRNSAADLRPERFEFPRLHGRFTYVAGSRHKLMGLVGHEINITNHFDDVGERMKEADFDPSKVKGGRPMHLIGLKPETRFDGPDRSYIGYPVDAFIVAGQDYHEHEYPTWAYCGIGFRGDAIGPDGTGLAIGGRTKNFTQPPPDAFLRPNHTWKRGFDARNADFTKAAVHLKAGQDIVWETNAGQVKLTADDNGDLIVTGPNGTRRL